MKCPRCGADNAEGAEFCSLCLERLRAPAAPADSAAGPLPGTRAGAYVAPGEWRGDMGTLKPAFSKAVETKVRHFRWKMVVYIALVAAIVAWIALSFTVWGNPSPTKQCNKLIAAVNARDEAAFMDLVLPGSESLGRERYLEITRFLGEGGEIEGTALKVDVLDNYEARGYLATDTIELIIALQNHKGTWYVDPSREVTVFTPRLP